MNPPFLITLSLIAAGAFTMWCAFRNYRWFFETGWQGYLLNRHASRNFARLLYFTIGLLVMAVGGARLVHPPRVIPDDFLFELARPDGIDLIAPREAATRLAADPRRNLELRTDDQGWVSFWRVIDPSEPFFQDAAEVSVAGGDFMTGFSLRRRELDGKVLEGRIVHFNERLESCDNWLFSKRPLSSARFVMILCTPEASAANGFGEGLALCFVRADTPAHAAIRKR